MHGPACGPTALIAHAWPCLGQAFAAAVQVPAQDRPTISILDRPAPASPAIHDATNEVIHPRDNPRPLTFPKQRPTPSHSINDESARYADGSLQSSADPESLVYPAACTLSSILDLSPRPRHLRYIIYTYPEDTRRSLSSGLAGIWLQWDGAILRVSRLRSRSTGAALRDGCRFVEAIKHCATPLTTNAG